VADDTIPSFNFTQDAKTNNDVSEAIRSTFSGGEWEGTFTDAKSGAIIRCHIQKTPNDIAVLNLKEASFTDEEAEHKARGELEAFMTSSSVAGNKCLLCLIPTTDQLLSTVLNIIETNLSELGYEKYVDFHCALLRYNDVAICIANKDMDRVFAALGDIQTIIKKNPSCFGSNMGVLGFDGDQNIGEQIPELFSEANKALNDSKRRQIDIVIEPQETSYLYQSYTQNLAKSVEIQRHYMIQPIIQMDTGKPSGYQIDVSTKKPLIVPDNIHCNSWTLMSKIVLPSKPGEAKSNLYVNWPVCLPHRLPADYLVRLNEKLKSWSNTNKTLVVLPITEINDSLLIALDRFNCCSEKNVEIALKPIRDMVTVIDQLPEDYVSNIVLDTFDLELDADSGYWQSAQAVLHIAASKSIEVILMNLNPRELSKATVYGFGMISSDYLEQSMSLEKFKSYVPKLYLNKINDIEFYLSNKQ
jgi:hypothetical protein